MAQATYAQIATLKNASTFQDRVTLAVVFYARYLLGQPATPLAKLIWARNAFQNPGSVASGLFSAVALDGTISDATVLGNATDAQIQTATEAVLVQALEF